MISKITRVYIRYYRDNKQTIAYVEWTDTRGLLGRTVGTPLIPGAAMNPQKGDPPLPVVYGEHMGALLARAICAGIEIERQTW